MDGDTYRVLAIPCPQNQEKQAVEYCKEFRILHLSKGETVCGPEEPVFTTLVPSHVGHYYRILLNILPRGKCSTLMRGPSQACTDGWLQLQPL